MSLLESKVALDFWLTLFSQFPPAEDPAYIKVSKETRMVCLAMSLKLMHNENFLRVFLMKKKKKEKYFFPSASLSETSSGCQPETNVHPQLLGYCIVLSHYNTWAVLRILHPIKLNCITWNEAFKIKILPLCTIIHHQNSMEQNTGRHNTGRH